MTPTSAEQPRHSVSRSRPGSDDFDRALGTGSIGEPNVGGEERARQRLCERHVAGVVRREVVTKDPHTAKKRFGRINRDITSTRSRSGPTIDSPEAEHGTCRHPVLRPPRKTRRPMHQRRARSTSIATPASWRERRPLERRSMRSIISSSVGIDAIAASCTDSTPKSVNCALIVRVSS